MTRQYKLQFTSSQRAEKHALSEFPCWPHNCKGFNICVTAPCRSVNKATEQDLFVCSAELFLGYLSFSKISLRLSRACLRREVLAYTALRAAAACPGTQGPNRPERPVLHHRQLTHRISWWFRVTVTRSMQNLVRGFAFYRTQPPKRVTQPFKRLC